MFDKIFFRYLFLIDVGDKIDIGDKIDVGEDRDLIFEVFILFLKFTNIKKRRFRDFLI